MEIAIQIISALLDIYILRIYLINALPHRKEYIGKVWFYSGMIITEILLQLNASLHIGSSDIISTVITNLISLITTFLLCFFFESKIAQNVTVSIIFQILVMLSENICIIISVIMYDTKLLNGYEYEIKMNLMSKIMMLVLITVLSFSLKKHKNQPTAYNALLLFTPTVSLVVLISLPFSNTYVNNNLMFFSIVWIYIAIINIVHSLLVEKLAKSYMSQMYASELERQVNYQKEKYLQLGEAYKTGRKIIHDIKHHNNVLKKYIREKKYDELYDYLSTYTSSLESAYVRVNSGNLVIDALVTNYNDMALSRGIKFISNLKIDNSKIPVSDYDLCTILGNLLDNSFHACEGLSKNAAEISISITSDKSDRFIIIVENTYNKSAVPTVSEIPNHGYGLENVRTAVESYHGLLKIQPDEKYKVLISIPVTNINQRYTPPLSLSGNND